LESGDKFGAWLFWSEKRREISDWIEKGCKTVEREKLSPDNFSDNIARLEAKIDILTKMFESICKHHNIEGTKNPVIFDSDVESDEDVPPVKPKRLLSKK
jgi:hypothetical protein